MLTSLAHKALDNRVRILRHGENAIIILCYQRNTMMLKPIVCIMVIKHLEQPLHELMTTWIDQLQILHGSERIGAITSSTTRYFHFCQHPFASFKDRNIHFRHHLLEIDCHEKASRTATNNCRFHIVCFSDAKLRCFRQLFKYYSYFCTHENHRSYRLLQRVHDICRGKPSRCRGYS